jgi:hypothetical protein
LDEEDAMIAGLLALHRRKQANIRGAGENEYERIARHFADRAQRLRGERLLTGELIAQLFDGAATLPRARVQQELVLVASPSGRAAGRFSVVNRTPRRAAFELVVGESLALEPRAALALSPAAGSLEPAGKCLVCVEADLHHWPAGATATLPVECRWPEGRDRIWVVLQTPEAAR